MMSTIILLFLLQFSTTQATADEPSFGPAISAYGPTYPIEDRYAAANPDVTTPNTGLVGDDHAHRIADGRLCALEVMRAGQRMSGVAPRLRE